MSGEVLAGLVGIAIAAPPTITLLAQIVDKHDPPNRLAQQLIFTTLMLLSIGLLLAVGALLAEHSRESDPLGYGLVAYVVFGFFFALISAVELIDLYTSSDGENDEKVDQTTD